MIFSRLPITETSQVLCRNSIELDRTQPKEDVFKRNERMYSRGMSGCIQEE